MKLIQNTILIFVSIFCLITSHALAETYFVGQNSSGNGEGSSFENRMSVSKHNSSSFIGNDIIYLCGTINSEVVVPSSGSDENNVITYSGACPGHRGIIDRGDGLTQNIGIKLKNKDNITIQDIEIQDAGFGIYAYDNVENFTVKRSKIHDLLMMGIVTDDSEYRNTNRNITVGGAEGDGNELWDIGSGTAGYDIKIHFAEDVLISYNHCYAEGGKDGAWGTNDDRGIKGISWHYIKNGVVEYNRVHDHRDGYSGAPSGSDGSWPLRGRGEGGIGGKGGENVIVRFNSVYNETGLAPGHGIVMSGNWTEYHVYGNQIENCNIGIFSYDGATSNDTDPEGRCGDGVEPGPGYIYNNIILDSVRWSGILVGYNSCSGAPDPDSVNGLYIYNNTIARNGSNPQAGSVYGIHFRGPYKNAVVKNNILFMNGPNSDKYTQIYVDSPSDVILESNHYYWPGKESFVEWGGKGKITIDTLKDDFNQEANGTQGDPLFVNPTENNFRLSLGSPCIDSGATLDTAFSRALNPDLTNWDSIVPTVYVGNQKSYGTKWEKGAYFYPDSVSNVDQDILFWSGFESESLNSETEFTSGDSVWELNGQSSISGSATKIGSSGLITYQDESYAELSINDDDIISDSEGRLGFWLKINTWLNWQNLLRIEADSENYFHLLLVNNEELRFNWHTSGTDESYCDTSSADLQTGVWYFIELAWNETYDTIEIYVNGELKSKSLNKISPIHSLSRLKVGGVIDAVNGSSELNFDNLMISSNYRRDFYSMRSDIAYSGEGLRSPTLRIIYGSSN